MMTTLLRSQILASFPNSRLKTPMVPGPQTSCVIRISALTQTFSPAWTRGLPAARARIFSVSVIRELSIHVWQNVAQTVWPTHKTETSVSATAQSDYATVGFGSTAKRWHREAGRISLFFGLFGCC